MASNTGTATTSEGVTVTVLVEPAPPSEERIADIGAVFSLFLGACVVVWCARRLLDLFTVNHHDET